MTAPKLRKPCKLWTGYVLNSGYGGRRRKIDGRTYHTAHAVAWVTTYGPVPDGMQVLHHCDVKLCIEPTHLWLGTQRDNMQDMVQKGRANRYERSGARNPNARYEALVDAIRNDYVPGTFGARRLSAKYGISRAQARRIAIGLVWST
jgi:hypothetical protein